MASLPPAEYLKHSGQASGIPIQASNHTALRPYSKDPGSKSDSIATQVVPIHTAIESAFLSLPSYPRRQIAYEHFKMKIWVDADACPVVIKDILFRAAERAKVMVVLVANQSMSHPQSEFIRSIIVGRDFDVADNEIVRQVQEGDIVITSDIPLAADVLSKGAHTLTPRGERYTKNNIESRLSMRNFMDTLRGSGEHSGGPAPLSAADRRAFANELDGFIARHQKNSKR